MSDLRNSLLGDSKKKLDTFEKSYDDCVHRIKRIKQKNDTLQKNAGTDLEDQIAVEVQKQKQHIETEILELKEQMDQIERKYRDPEAKNKMKDVKKQAHKEIERNKAVLREFINKSFLNVKNAKRSRASNGSDDQNKYFEDGKNSLIEDDAPKNNTRNNGYQNGYQNENNYNQTRQYQPYNFSKNKQHQESELDIDYELQNRLEDEKNELLKNVERDAEKILNIVTDAAEIVNEADDMLDHITDNVVNTNKNVQIANKKMEEAGEYQKKARKKYIIFTVIIVLVVALVTGVILIVKL